MTEKQSTKDAIMTTCYTPHGATLTIEEDGEKIFEFSVSFEETKRLAESLRINAERAEFQDKLTKE